MITEKEINERANKLRKIYHESKHYKVDTAEKILKSLVGKNLFFDFYMDSGGVVVDTKRTDKTNVGQIIPVRIVVNDNEIRVICFAKKRLGCVCGIDEVEKAVDAAEKIIEYMQQNTYIISPRTSSKPVSPSERPTPVDGNALW